MSAAGQGATGPQVDVALLLEGTYPFVRGGVSGWVHKLIEGFPETTFSVVFLGGRRCDHGEPAYALPANVRHFERHYLFEPEGAPAPPRPDEGGALEEIDGLHRILRTTGPEVPMDGPMLERLARLLGEPGGITRGLFLHGDASWERLCDGYRRECPDASFADYFWTIRAMHSSIFTLADIARRLPPARVSHAVSTGYAGLLGALLRHRRGQPLVLTEHGIYTKERKIDLASAERVPGDESDGTGLGFGRRLWIRFFQGLGRIAYSSADAVIALYEGNRRRQIVDGAEPSRTRVIPNGVDVDRFRALRDRRAAEPPPVIGFVGRVVPIKDVKTFIRAMKTVVAQWPQAEGWIVGPTSEDQSYADECSHLVSSLGLEGRLAFRGFQAPEEILPRLGLLALSSISEALPLVVLEAFAAGLPVLSTDVGACRELIEGRTGEDRALGTAGAVVPIADPEALAGAALELMRDPSRWRGAQQAAIRRVERYYTQGHMIDAYRRVYEEAGAWRA